MIESPPSPPEQETVDIADPEEARDFIRQRMEEGGEFPTITVPEKYADAARHGIMPHTTWIFDSIIAGTLGRDPYLPSDEPRITFRVKVSTDMVAPRFTGPDRHFHGVVMFRRGIPGELLEEIAHAY